MRFSSWTIDPLYDNESCMELGAIEIIMHIMGRYHRRLKSMLMKTDTKN